MGTSSGGLTVAKIRAARAILERGQHLEQQVWCMLDGIAQAHHVPLAALMISCFAHPETREDVWAVEAAPGWVFTASVEECLAACTHELREMMKRASEISSVFPASTASPLSGTGVYGQEWPREIPDTPLDEWNAGVDALLAECEAWEVATQRTIEES